MSREQTSSKTCYETQHFTSPWELLVYIIVAIVPGFSTRCVLAAPGLGSISFASQSGEAHDKWFFPILFYLVRAPVLANGMWDQVRVDHGSLTLYIQQILSTHWRNTQRLPYVQSTSKAVSTVNEW